MVLLSWTKFLAHYGYLRFAPPMHRSIIYLWRSKPISTPSRVSLRSEVPMFFLVPGFLALALCFFSQLSNQDSSSPLFSLLTKNQRSLPFPPRGSFALRESNLFSCHPPFPQTPVPALFLTESGSANSLCGWIDPHFLFFDFFEKVSFF